MKKLFLLLALLVSLPAAGQANSYGFCADINDNFVRLVRVYRPRAIVLYAGDNDLHDGKTPDEVVADFNKFMFIKRAFCRSCM